MRLTTELFWCGVRKKQLSAQIPGAWRREGREGSSQQAEVAAGRLMQGELPGRLLQRLPVGAESSLAHPPG